VQTFANDTDTYNSTLTLEISSIYHKNLLVGMAKLFMKRLCRNYILEYKQDMNI